MSIRDPSHHPDRQYLSDPRRVKEFRKYYQTRHAFHRQSLSGPVKIPPAETPGPTYPTPAAVAEPDYTIAAFAKCAVHSIDVDKVMVTLLDGSTQYFLGGATKSTSSIAESEADSALWFGCETIGSEGGICEVAVCMRRSATEEHPIYIVPNIGEVPHWADFRLPYNFYAGTPIITRNGYNIGTLFAFSTRSRPDLEPEEKLVMVRIAKQVMSHLELELRVLERNRLMEMNRCLAEFGAARRVSSSSAGWLDQARLMPPETASHATSGEASAVSILPGEAIYPRAARLLQAGLGCTGVAFLATDRNRTMRSTSSPDGSKGFPSEKWRFSMDSQIQGGSSSNIRVLACASASDKQDCSRLTTLSNDLLLELIELYPKGKLFHFDAAGKLVPAMGADPAPTNNDNDSPQHTLNGEGSSEVHPAVGLRQCLPRARQIILTSMLDPRKDNLSVAAIAWSDGWERLYTGDFDLPYMTSFCMAAIAMVLHEEAIVANKQKADFIGSISHELRSPLHGILASTELLRDTNCDSTQQYLMASVQSCGRLLLDTIDHVLDFGKITSIEKSSGTPRRQSLPLDGKQSKPDTLDSGLMQEGQLLNRPVVIDLASLCEEVMDSVLLGRSYHDALAPTNDFGPSNNTLSPHQIRPVISLDVAKREWRFISQPGAIQRIIMNLFGNALKYTADGYIRVQLEAEDIPAEADRSQGTTLAKLTLSDSGRGMSPDFIQSRLWTPFAQEDQTAQGTGLGLSITKRVVNVLGGDIDLQSKLGVGTTFTVRLPLRSPPTKDDGPQASQNSSLDSTMDISQRCSSLRQQLQGKAFIVFGPYSTSASADQSAGIIHMRESLLRYLEDWFGMTPMSSSGTPVDLVIVDESVPWSHASPDIDIFLSDKPRIVLGANPTAKLGSLQVGASKENMVYVTKPVGPRKLERALRHLLPHILGTSSAKDTLPTNTTVSAPLNVGPVSNHSLNDEHTDSRLMEVSPPYKQTQQETAPSKEEGTASKCPSDSTTASNNRVAELEAELQRLRLLLDEVRPSVDKTKPQAPNGLPTPQVSPGSEARETASPALAIRIAPPRPPDDGIPRILLVDDNAINLRVLSMYLRKAKIPEAKAVAVSSGEDAVAQYTQASAQGVPFDIVLMDLSMPGMDGFDATREIRAFESRGDGTCKKALVVALTGLVSERDRDRALEAGVDRYFIKPFSGKQVDGLLEYWKETMKADGPG